MTIAAAIRMTTIPRISPMVQPVEAANRACISHFLRSLARTAERSFREHSHDVPLVFLRPTLVRDRFARRFGQLGRAGERLLARRLPDEGILRTGARDVCADGGEREACGRDRSVFVEVQRRA